MPCVCDDACIYVAKDMRSDSCIRDLRCGPRKEVVAFNRPHSYRRQGDGCLGIHGLSSPRLHPAREHPFLFRIPTASAQATRRRLDVRPVAAGRAEKRQLPTSVRHDERRPRDHESRVPEPGRVSPFRDCQAVMFLRSG